MLRVSRLLALAFAALALSSCSDFEGFDFSKAERGIYRIYAEVRGIDSDKKPVTKYSWGTAFLVSGVNIVATNASIVNNAALDERGQPKIWLYFLDARRQPQRAYATIRRETRQITTDRNSTGPDIAILEVDKELPGTPLTLADLKSLNPDGSEVKAIGYPFKADIMGPHQLNIMNNPGLLIATKTSGQVSRSYSWNEIPIIQHQAPIERGFYGGPLFDACGIVIGMNTFGAGDTIIGAAVDSRELVKLLRLLGVKFETRDSLCNQRLSSLYFPLFVGGAAVLLSIVAILIAYRRSGSPGLGEPAMAVPGGGALGGDALLPAGHAASHRPTTLGSERQPGGSQLGDRSATGNDSAGKGLVKLVPQAAGTAPYGITLAHLANRGATIGRDQSCDVVLKSDTVSKSHARLSLNAGSLMVEDLGSGNGTFIGSERVTSAVVGNGDVVRFGDVTFAVEIRQELAAAAVAAVPQSRPGSKHSGAEPARGWRLTGKDGSNKPVEIVLQPQFDTAGKPLATEWTVGRSTEKAEIVVADPSVSSLHLRMRYVPGQGLQLSDAGSSNGTHLDGKKLGNAYVPVKAKQVVQLGKVRLTINAG